MDENQRGGWVYIMADRYRHDVCRRHCAFGGQSASASGRHGIGFLSRYGLDRLVWAERGDLIETCIAHEKRLKRWRREWKFALIERGNPDWRDLSDLLA